MEIMDMAAAIGLRIKECPEGLRYEKAKKDYESCKEINMALIEYQVQQQVLEHQRDAEELDTQLIENVNARIDALYKTITEHPLYIEFEQAQEELNELIKKVNRTIIAQITGERPDSCTHVCSTCGGCH